jgi:hypothetical protein
MDVEVFDSSSNSAKFARKCAVADYSSRSADDEALHAALDLPVAGYRFLVTRTIGG